MSKSKYTEELAQRIITLASQGQTNVEIAKSLQIGKSTLSRWIAGNPKLKEAVGRRDHPDKFREKDLREGILDWLLEDINSRGETTEVIEKNEESGVITKTRLGARVPSHYLAYLSELQKNDEEREFTVRLEVAIPEDFGDN